VQAGGVGPNTKQSHSPPPPAPLVVEDVELEELELLLELEDELELDELPPLPPLVDDELEEEFEESSGSKSSTRPVAYISSSPVVSSNLADAPPVSSIAAGAATPAINARIIAFSSSDVEPRSFLSLLIFPLSKNIERKK